jgi:hypothetical protein
MRKGKEKQAYRGSSSQVSLRRNVTGGSEVGRNTDRLEKTGGREGGLGGGKAEVELATRHTSLFERAGQESDVLRLLLCGELDAVTNGVGVTG